MSRASSAVVVADAATLELRRFSTLARLAPVGIMETDLEGRCRWVNDAWKALTGLSAERAAGLGWLETVHADDRDDVLAAWQVTVDSGSDLNLEYRIQTGEGHVRWVQSSAAALLDDAGRAGGYLRTVTDVTERVLASRRFEQLLQSAPDAMICVSRHGRIVSANDQTERLFGYAEAELVGKPVELLVPERARSSHQLERAGYFHAPRVRPMGGSGRVLYGRRKDGSEFQCEVSLSAIDSDEGPIAVAAIRDVTARVRIERLYRAVAENFPNGTIVMFDHDLRQLLVRGEGLGVIGVDPEAVEGRTLAESFDQETVGHVEPLVRRALAGDSVHAQVGFLNRVINVNVVPLRNGRGEVFAAMLIGEDVTAQHETELALRRSEDRRNHALAKLLEAQEEERANIAGDLHDDTIQVMTAALIRLDTAKHTVAHHGEAHQAVIRARDTLAEAIERTRKLTFDLRPQLLDAEGLAPALTALAEKTAADAGFALHLGIHLDRYSDLIESLVFRTVQEALANTDRHAEATSVDIAIHETDGVIQGTVTDDGKGFDIESTRSRVRATHHFGVEISAERLRLAGGTYAIHSGPGKGTRVEFTLPVHRADDNPKR